MTAADFGGAGDAITEVEHKQKLSGCHGQSLSAFAVAWWLEHLMTQPPGNAARR